MIAIAEYMSERKFARSIKGVIDLPQAFGGSWTLRKLEILDKYSDFYLTAMKNRPFKLCYIDAFAGSGWVEVRGHGEIRGSALRALERPFDRYIFIEKKKEYTEQLEVIRANYPEKLIDIELGDCNEILKRLSTEPWYDNFWRGIIFLDPYAMNVEWETLKAIAKTQAFDLWYLFPLSALLRVLRKDGRITVQNKYRLNMLLGTCEWEKALYSESIQMSLFDEIDLERETVQGIIKYVVGRMQDVFPAVSPNPRILRQTRNNSPLFLLCFAVSNPNKKAIDLSLKVADHILMHD